MLIEHHLEEILCNNKPAVMAAIRTEIGNAMKAQNQRKKARMKIKPSQQPFYCQRIDEQLLLYFDRKINIGSS